MLVGMMREFRLFVRLFGVDTAKARIEALENP